MKTIRHTKTLFYFDGPQVIEANDNDGQEYTEAKMNGFPEAATGGH